jgi:GNAT superfamily N-acetyltransferase
VEEVVLRPYEPAVAPVVTDLWLRTIGERYPLREEVLHGCLEDNPSYRPGDALVAWDGDRAVGFGYLGLLREDDPETIDQRGRAWLQAVVVDAEHRRARVGSRIVAGLATVAHRAGIAGIDCGTGFFYLWPGLPADLPDARPFAEALGFVTGERTWDLRGDVSGLTADAGAADLVAATGMRTVPARAVDRDALLRFLHREFGGEWWHDTRWFLDMGGDIADIVLLRDPSGDIVGCARLHTPATRPVGPPLFWAARRPVAAGGLGPIGVAAALRGRGLGKALLALALARLRDQQLDDVVIDFTTLLGFYGPLGFEPWMEFVHASGTVAEVLARARGAGRGTDGKA